MNIVFYGNRQIGMIGLLTVMALGHEIIEVWEDTNYKMPGIDDLPLQRKDIHINENLKTRLKGVDLLLCVHGRKFVPEYILERFKFGGVNLHPFLDKYPGANPIERAIAAGEKIATVYAHKMSSTIDQGEILACASKNIPTKSELPSLDAIHIYNEIYPLYVQVIISVLKKLHTNGLSRREYCE